MPPPALRREPWHERSIQGWAHSFSARGQVLPDLDRMVGGVGDPNDQQAVKPAVRGIERVARNIEQTSIRGFGVVGPQDLMRSAQHRQGNATGSGRRKRGGSRGIRADAGSCMPAGRR
jgi:hypothetical protein